MHQLMCVQTNMVCAKEWWWYKSWGVILHSETARDRRAREMAGRLPPLDRRKLLHRQEEVALRRRVLQPRRVLARRAAAQHEDDAAALERPLERHRQQHREHRLGALAAARLRQRVLLKRRLPRAAGVDCCE